MGRTLRVARTKWIGLSMVLDCSILISRKNHSIAKLVVAYHDSRRTGVIKWFDTMPAQLPRDLIQILRRGGRLLAIAWSPDASQFAIADIKD